MEKNFGFSQKMVEWLFVWNRETNAKPCPVFIGPKSPTFKTNKLMQF